YCRIRSERSPTDLRASTRNSRGNEHRASWPTSFANLLSSIVNQPPDIAQFVVRNVSGHIQERRHGTGGATRKERGQHVLQRRLPCRFHRDGGTVEIPLALLSEKKNSFFDERPEHRADRRVGRWIGEFPQHLPHGGFTQPVHRFDDLALAMAKRRSL